MSRGELDNRFNPYGLTLSLLKTAREQLPVMIFYHLIFDQPFPSPYDN